MHFGRRKRNVIEKSLPNPVKPGSLEWYLEEWRKDRLVERYVWWVHEQMANEDMRKKLMEYNEFMNALVEEIFGKKEH